MGLQFTTLNYLEEFDVFRRRVLRCPADTYKFAPSRFAMCWRHRRIVSVLRVAVLAWLALFPFQSPRAVFGVVRTIAYSGLKPLVVGEDISFKWFSNPSFNNRGDVVFTATLAGEGVNSANDTSLWFGASGGSLQVIAREGAIAAGLPEGAAFGAFANDFASGAALNDVGQYAFAAPVSLAGNQIRTGVLAGASDRALNLLALSGMAAPGVPDGSDFLIASTVRPTINRHGTVALAARLTGDFYTSPEYGTADGIWQGQFDGEMLPVILIGEAAGGLGDDATLVALAPANAQISIDGRGRVAVQGVYIVSGSDSWDGRGVWSAVDNGLELVAWSGMTWPDIGPDTLVHPAMSIGGVDGAGRMAIFGQNSVLPIGTGGQFIGVVGGDRAEIVAYSGEIAPGTEGTSEFVNFGNLPVMSSDGTVAFYGSIRHVLGGGRPSDALYAGKAGDLKLIAFAGMDAPGLDAWFNWFLDSAASVNRFGQVAFASGLTGQESGQSLWATDLAGNLVLVARYGDVVEVAPGDERVIGTVSMISGHGDDDGRARGLNDWGEIAFLARFTDGTSGVLVSDAAAGLPGDYDVNGVVDAADYTVWRDAVASQDLRADGDRDGAVDERDSLLWKEFYGFSRDVLVGSADFQPVPEPSGAGAMAVGAVLWGGRRRQAGRTNSDGRVTEK